MAGLIFILPLLAFDLWLVFTTGRRTVRLWLESQKWRDLALACAAGVALAVILPVFIRYSNGPKLRAQGFPVPIRFFHLQDNQTWSENPLGGVLGCLGLATDIITGLVAPLIPYKVAEFLKVVKAEMK